MPPTQLRIVCHVLGSWRSTAGPWCSPLIGSWRCDKYSIFASNALRSSQGPKLWQYCIMISVIVSTHRCCILLKVAFTFPRDRAALQSTEEEWLTRFILLSAGSMWQTPLFHLNPTARVCWVLSPSAKMRNLRHRSSVTNQGLEVNKL